MEDALGGSCENTIPRSQRCCEAEQGTCESNGISEETTNSFGELTAKQKLMLSCHDLTGAWLTVRGDCTFAGGAKICDL